MRPSTKSELFRQDHGIPANAIVIGLDESGVGSIFGPMIVAGTINDRNWDHPHVKDSKKVRVASKRDDLGAKIASNMLWCHSVAEASTINQYGYAPTLNALFRSVVTNMVCPIRQADPGRPIVLVIDGREQNNNLRAFVETYFTGVSIYYLVRADAKCFEVSAASLIAKVELDARIIRYCNDHPDIAEKYSLASNKGYGSEDHSRGILSNGLTEHHRVAPCQKIIRKRSKGKVNGFAAA